MRFLLLLCLCTLSVFGQVANNECSGATSVTVNPTSACSVSAPVLFTGATASANTTTCNGPNGPDVWFTFTATNNAHGIRLDNFTGTPNPVGIALYEGNICGELIQLTCSYNNAINATNLTVGAIYKIRLYLRLTNPVLNTAFTLCVNTPPPPVNNQQNACVINTVNASFEQPGIGLNSLSFIHHNTVQGWRTTASDQTMEYWSSGFQGVPSYEGNQFIELNANFVSGIYQDYNTAEPTTFTYSFAHRGRNVGNNPNTGPDVIQLKAGPPGGPYVNVDGPRSTTAAAWVVYTGTYTSPANQPVTRFLFQSVSSGSNDQSIGNFLDAIAFTANNGILSANPVNLNCVENVTSVQAAGSGIWIAHSDNPGPSIIANPNSNTTTISGFTADGTYQYDWNTSTCISTLVINYNGSLADAPVVTTPVEYCAGQAATPLTATPTGNNTLNWYTQETGGTALNAAPVPDTATATAPNGITYYVSQTSANGCESPRVAITVLVYDILPPPVVDNVAYCQNDAAVPLTATAAEGGTLRWYTQPDGGTPLTEAPTPDTSQPGITNYYVSQYTSPACEGSRAAISVTVTEVVARVAGFNYDSIYCSPPVNSGTVLPQYENGFTTGGIFTSGPGLVINADTGEIDIAASEPGQYTVTYTLQEINVCSPQLSFSDDLTISANPVIPSIPVYALCDDNASGDGIETFDLQGVVTPQANAGNPTYQVSYYASAEQANSATGALGGSYQNTQVGQQTLYVRVQDPATGCYSVAEFIIRVNPLPLIDTNLSPYAACESAPGQADYDLSTLNDDVTLGAQGYVVSYYNSAQDAADGQDAIAGQFTSGPRTVYIRVQDATTGCFTTTQVSLTVTPAPVAPTLIPLQECDANNDQVATFDLTPVLTQLQGQFPGAAVTIFETQGDAEFNALNNAVANTGAYTNVNALTTNGVQTLYVRITAPGGDCYDIAELQLIVNPTPLASEPSEYALCDSDGDGVATFDLTTKNEEALTGQDPLQYSVSYYYEGVLITGPTAYQSPSRTLVVRITNTATGCFKETALELIVHELPVAIAPQPYSLCDVNSPGDEKEVFDLTSRTAEILGGDNVQGVALSFHLSLSDAQAGINPITNAGSYTNLTTVQAIYVRVTNQATGCYRVVLLDIRVEPLPSLTLPGEGEVFVCDPDGNGIATFDLQARVEALINNGSDIDVSFYETQQDAQNDVNPIANPESFTNNVPFSQVIYIRAENTITGCVGLIGNAITIVVVPSPQLPQLPDLTLCDEDQADQDGVTAFDLTLQNGVIYPQGVPDTIEITYYTSQEAARAGQPRIITDTAYQGQDGQAIWVRVEESQSGCFGIESFTLRVGTPLLLTQPAMFTQCNTALPNDAVGTFDLTTRRNEILGPLGIGQGYTLSWYTQDPEGLEPEELAGILIEDPTAFTNTSPGPQTVYVMATSPEGCRSYTTLTVKELPLPTPKTDPAPLAACDSDGDGQADFTLTERDAYIRSNDASLILTYHQSLEDAQGDVNPIDTTIAYTSASATVYVRVEGTPANPGDPSCYQVVELALVVNPSPVVGDEGTNLVTIAQCKEGNDGFDTFVLSDYYDVIFPGQDLSGYTIRFYANQADFDAGVAIEPTEGYVNTVAFSQDVIVTIVNEETGCDTQGVVRLVVEEQPLAPLPEELQPILICDDADGASDGIAGFNLTQLEAAILNGQGFSVSYYTSEADAQNGTNAITTPEAYRNEASPYEQVIYVRVSNSQASAGCAAFTSFVIQAQGRPEPVLLPGTICVDYVTGEVVRPYTFATGLDDTHTLTWYFNGEIIPGATGPEYTATEEGEYTVIAQSSAGCVSEPLTPVRVSLSGPASPVGTGYEVSGAFSESQQISISAEGFGEYAYRLDDGPYQSSPVFTNVSPGSHVVYVKDVSTDSPCDDQGLILEIESLSIIDYPNFFTPNGDNYHDYWNVIGLEEQGASTTIYIFDRYGKLMKQISSASQGWDGTYNGQPAPADDYWFTINYPEVVNGQVVMREFKSHFALKR